MKNAEHDQPPSHEELRDTLAREGIIPRDPELERVFQTERARMFNLLTDHNGDGTSDDEKALALSRKSTSPIQIASFEC